MTHLDLVLDWTTVIPLTLVHVIAYLAVACIIGCVALRRPWLEGQALGLLIVLAAATLALYAAQGLHASLPIFVLLAMAFTSAITVTLRLVVFQEAAKPSRTDVLTEPAAIVLLGLVAAVRMMTPDPQAGYDIYQAWYPLYLDTALRMGFLPLAHALPMGAGYLTTDQLAYSADGLGLAGVAAVLTGGHTHPAFFGLSVAVTLAVLGVLTQTAGRSRWALLLWLMLAGISLRWSPAIHTVLLDNWCEAGMLLGGAVAAHFLVAGENRDVARLGAAFATAMMVVSRPYGAVYAAVLASGLFLLEWHEHSFRRILLPWSLCAIFLAAASAREILLVISGGIYYVRPHMADFLMTLSPIRRLYYILGDIGIVPEPHVFPHALPLAAPTLIAALVWVIRGNGRSLRRLLIVTGPLLLFLGPIVTEYLTGYRKYAFSKLYLSVVILLPWYPAVFLTWMRDRFMRARWQAPSKKRLALSGGVLGAGACAAAAILAIPGFHAKFDRVVWTYRHNNTDLMVAKTLADQDSALLDDVMHKKIMYTYTEPGAGLRYYLGGDMFSDLDFWSDSVQSVLKVSHDPSTFLQNLGWPAVYLSYPDWAGNQGNWLQYTGWQKMADELDAMDTRLPYVRCIITAATGRLIITGPPLLDQDKSEGCRSGG